MTFRAFMPSIRTLRHLADMDGPFPIKSRHVLLAAERFGYGDNMLAFLRLFPPDQVFHSREEFIAHCTALQSLIREERAVADSWAVHKV